MSTTDDERLTVPPAPEERPTRPGWVPWVAVAAALAVVAVVAGVLLATGGDDPTVAPPAATQTATRPAPTASSSPPASSTAPSTTATTSAPGGVIEAVPVYYVGASKTGFWLYREFREVPDVGGAVASAVMAMTRLEPLDPDYSSPWSPASRVSVTRSGEALAVDLSPDAFSVGTGSQLAGLAIQQLVYTATAAAQTSGPVTITVDGEPYDAWGVVRVGTPVSRAPQQDVQAPTCILSPAEGSTVPAGDVVVEGYGTAFEAVFGWEVRADDGTVVDSGSVTGEGGMGTYGAFQLTVPDLAPGDYVVEAWGSDPSDGASAEGPRLYPDSKAFTVEDGD